MAAKRGTRYLALLPSIFHKKPPPESRELSWTDYLQPYEAVGDEFDTLLATLDLKFAPELAPQETFLKWLATWVALRVDGDWRSDETRRIIGEAVELYRWRGTVSGIKRYLELYARVPREQIDIEEGRWPGGMQIGVASRIGGKAPLPAEEPPWSGPRVEYGDFYVVTTEAPTEMPTEMPPDVERPLPPGTRLRLYYPVEQVERVTIEETGVHIRYRPPGGEEATTYFHARPTRAGPEGEDDTTAPTDDGPNIDRLSGQITYRYLRDSSDTEAFHGGSYLIESVPAPYRFIVWWETPGAEDPDWAAESRQLVKVRRVLELEKPAHSDDYLRALPPGPAPPPNWMQIEVRSNIGLDTTVG